MKYSKQMDGLNGIVVINKPSGMTSHDVVARARKVLGFKKIGHAGTLDPLATGVLILLVGQSTKLFDKFMAFDKGYRATMILGKRTTTADIQGEVIFEKQCAHITAEDVSGIFKEFEGEVDQVPPMVSALKVNGKRLYDLARQGIEVKREPRRVLISRIELLNFQPPQVSFFLHCSKGTYVRQLAEDVGERLGCGACISQIERTHVGPFSIEDSLDLGDLNPSHVRLWEAGGLEAE